MILSAYNKLPIILQNVACSVAGIQIKFKRYSNYFYHILKCLEETDKWPLEQLREYQNRRLREIICHCYETVPFYREQFDQLKIQPEDIQTVEDLKVLPVLTKDVVKANKNRLISKNFSLKTLERAKTSGTTGAGMEFFRQRSTDQFQWAVWWRFRRRFGIDLYDRHANFAGKPVVPRNQKKPPFWRQNLPLHQTYFSGYHFKDEYIPYFIDYIDKQDFKYYSGYPSVISILAEFMITHNIRLSKPPKIIVTGSETLLRSQAQLISKAFNCPVVDQYGACERVCNMSMCPAGNYHEDMELGIIEREVIQQSPHGYVSRIIATGLVDEAMPLLRYDIGDVATFVNKSCSCGRSSPIACSIDGRTEGIIITPEGLKIGRMAYVFSDLPNVYESQIVQDRLNHLIVRVRKTPAYTKDDENEFRKRILNMVGQRMQLSFEYVDRVPREKNGKLRAVISQLSENI